ncbi:ruBisCO-associated protein-like [Senna tora]|uniref:RuBisCO-associated protein-like n=1 Tax=Senna tora TaxID=362788 RepID=A0A834WEE7_9FABA|nr:ruBisCO-associated protein-like [Senna tora]
MAPKLSTYRVYTNDDSFKNLQNVSVGEIHVVLASAVDYDKNGNSTDGKYIPYFDEQKVTPDVISCFKAQSKSPVKFFKAHGDHRQVQSRWHRYLLPQNQCYLENKSYPWKAMKVEVFCPPQLLEALLIWLLCGHSQVAQRLSLFSEDLHNFLIEFCHAPQSCKNCEYGSSIQRLQPLELISFSFLTILSEKTNAFEAKIQKSCSESDTPEWQNHLSDFPLCYLNSSQKHRAPKEKLLQQLS